MREGVVADLVPFVVNAARQRGVVVRLNANEEEGCGRVLALQHIENFRGPLRIGTVVEGDRDLFGRGAVTRDAIGFGQVLKDLVSDQPGGGIDRDVAFAVRRARFDAQNFTLAFHVDVLAGRNISQLVGRGGLAWDDPRPSTTSGLPNPAAIARRS